MSGSLEKFVIQRFDGSDFSLWKCEIKVYLAGHGYWGVVDGSSTRPTTQNEAAIWDEKDNKAMYVIMHGVERDLRRHLINCTSAKEMWDKLLSIHEQKCEMSVDLALEKFCSYRMKEDDTIANHVASVETLAQELSNLGAARDEKDIINRITSSLPLKYRHVVTSWNASAKEKKTRNELVARLLQEELTLKNLVQVESKMEAVALFAGKKAHQKKKSTQRGSVEEQKKKFPCHNCGQLNHWARECPKPKKNRGREKSKLALSAVSSVFASSSKKNFWYLDSAANNKLTGQRGWFHSFTELGSNEKPIKYGDGKVLYARGVGSIDVRRFVQGEWLEAEINNVFYVPEMEENLFSLSALTDAGMVVQFCGDRLFAKKNGKVVLEGIQTENKMWQLLIEFDPNSQANMASSAASMATWHERLGHVNAETLKKMKSSGSVVGLDFKASQEFFCEPCVLSKQKRVSHPVSTTRASVPGELFHMDICGPFSTPSFGGSNYYVVLKDDFSNYCFLYFLKQRSDILSKLEDFVVLCEAAGHPVKRIRSDQAREFVSEEAKKFYRKNKILHETSSPHTPQQNGRSEREIRTITEGIRTLLCSSELPEALWAEAGNTFVYVRNRTAIARLEGKTPFELWTGKKPDVSHLRVFGSDAYAIVQRKKQSKIKPQSEKLVFVGYKFESKAYKLWMRGTKDFYENCNVTFKENIRAESSCEVEIGSEFEDQESSSVRDVAHEQEVGESSVVEHVVSSTRRKRGPNKKYPVVEIPYNLRRNKMENIETGSNEQSIANLGYCFLATSDPTSLQEALESDEKDQWEQAIREELDSLDQNSTYNLVELPPGRKPIKNKWVFRKKCNDDGTVVRYKARLVVKGCSQVKGLDFQETFAPVVRYESVRTLLSIATATDMEIAQFDVKTAFLHGDLDEEIFMLQPEGFEDGTNRVCKLKKSLYGLKQAPRQWHQKLKNLLVQFGFEPTIADPCVFVNKSVEMLLAIYVDDGLACAKRKQDIETLFEKLKNEFEISVLDGNFFVSLQIRRNREKKILHVSQQTYAEKVLERFAMLDCHPISVPADPSSNLAKFEGKLDEKFPYRELVGSLMYLAVGTRPDIAYIVSKLSQFLEHPSVEHWNAAKRVLKYLKGTVNYGIEFKFDKTNANKLIAFGDADFAKSEDRRSISGVVLLLNNGPIVWSSRRQTGVTLSTTEAELVASSAAAQEVVWSRRLLHNIGFEQTAATQLNCDNAGMIKLAKNNVFHKRTKHVDIKYFYVREKVEEGVLEPVYVASAENLADMFTKPLPQASFAKLRESVGVVPFDV